MGQRDGRGVQAQLIIVQISVKGGQFRASGRLRCCSFVFPLLQSMGSSRKKRGSLALPPWQRGKLAALPPRSSATSSASVSQRTRTGTSTSSFDGGRSGTGKSLEAQAPEHSCKQRESRPPLDVGGPSGGVKKKIKSKPQKGFGRALLPNGDTVTTKGDCKKFFGCKNCPHAWVREQVARLQRPCRDCGLVDWSPFEFTEKDFAFSRAQPIPKVKEPEVKEPMLEEVSPRSFLPVAKQPAGRIVQGLLAGARRLEPRPPPGKSPVGITAGELHPPVDPTVWGSTWPAVKKQLFTLQQEACLVDHGKPPPGKPPAGASGRFPPVPKAALFAQHVGPRVAVAHATVPDSQPQEPVARAPVEVETSPTLQPPPGVWELPSSGERGALGCRCGGDCIGEPGSQLYRISRSAAGDAGIYCERCVRVVMKDDAMLKTTKVTHDEAQRDRSRALRSRAPKKVPGVWV